MNKKLIVLILSVFLLLSTVLICLIGMQPDPPKVSVGSIEFALQNDGNEYICEYIPNEDGTMEEVVKGVVLNINDIAEEDGKIIITYQAKIKILPTDANNKEVIFNSLDPDKADLFTFTQVSEDNTELFLVTITLTKKVATDLKIKVTSADDSVSASAEFVIRLKYNPKDDVDLK